MTPTRAQAYAGGSFEQRFDQATAKQANTQAYAAALKYAGVTESDVTSASTEEQNISGCDENSFTNFGLNFQSPFCTHTAQQKVFLIRLETATKLCKFHSSEGGYEVDNVGVTYLQNGCVTKQ